MLKDKAAILAGRRIDLARNLNLARGRLEQPGDDLKHGRLAAAAWTENDDEFAGRTARLKSLIAVTPPG